MTKVYNEKRVHNSVTVLEMPHNTVIAQKKLAKDGYDALVIGFEKMKASNLKKPQKMFFSKNKIPPLRKIKEFRVSADNFVETGRSISVSHFTVGQFVDVKSYSIGKGFAGAMKRHNFAGLRASHGVSISHRSHGSTGNSQDPGRVWKGKKMAGQLGNKIVTVQNLEVVSIDSERGLILVKGGVPGAVGTWVRITDAKKKSLPASTPYPAGVNNDDTNKTNLEKEAKGETSNIKKDEVLEKKDLSESVSKKEIKDVSSKIKKDEVVGKKDLDTKENNK